jgi:hypothetical protein
MARILPRGNLTRQAQIAPVETACPQAVRDVGVPVPVSQNLLCRDWLPESSRSTYKVAVEQIPSPVPPTPRRNWWKRNWKWFVPLGCFSIALLFVVFIGSVVVIVFSAVKSTDVYKDALTRAKSHPAVIEALGSPVTEGFFVSGSTNVNGASGEANLAIPVSGPKGKGTIYVAAKKSLGRWEYSGLVLEIANTHQRIDLLGSSAGAQSP